MLAPGGTLVFVGLPQENETPVPIFETVLNGITIVGSIGLLIHVPWAIVEWFPGIGHYPRSLLGTDLEKVANTYPPTICFMLVGFWLIALVHCEGPGHLARLDRPRRRSEAVAVMVDVPRDLRKASFASRYENGLAGPRHPSADPVPRR